MNVRNFLAPGDFVLTVPAGLNVTLQYDEKGIIQKILAGLDPAGVELPDELLRAILPSGIIPTTISVKQGTTWISGIFTHAGLMSENSGALPDDIVGDISADLMDNPTVFTFHATSVVSNALKFSGGLASQRWLQNSGFETLPNFVIPASVSNDQWDKITSKVDFVIVGLLILHNWEWQYVSCEVRQDKVVSVSKQFDDAGYLRGIISLDSGDKFDTDYYDVVKYNIQPKSIVIHDNYHVIQLVPSDDKKVREPRPSKIECPTCGSVILINSELSSCSNISCPSRYYENTSHFLSVLGLPVLSRSRYSELFKGDSEIRYEKLFTAPEYQSSQVTVTPYQLVRAVMPVTVVRSDKAIEELCSKCNNSVSSILYHLKHLDRVHVELGLAPEYVSALLPVSKHLYLVDDLDTLFHHINIEVRSVDVKFDGPQIFRGRCISLTGEFMHGSHAEVSAILRSYGASIVIDSSDADCLIVGDTLDGVNGQVIRKAQYDHVPVFTETDFFAKYEIDDDLQQGGNL